MLTALALAAALLPRPTSEETGDLAWFEGSWDQALAAAGEDRIVFVDFWATWCAPCKTMERTTFADERVIDMLRERFVPVSIDVETEPGTQIALRYGAELLPALVFVDGEGRPIDSLQGFHGPDMFLEEIRRIAAGTDTLPDYRRRIAESPDDIELRFVLAQKSLAVNDEAAYYEQMAAIERLDPERRSLVLRRVDMRELVLDLESTLEGGPLREFLADETHPELLFEGWYTLSMLENALQRRAEAAGDDDALAKHRLGVLDAMRKAWAHVPEANVPGFGGMLAWFVYENREHLEEEDLRFGLAVAQEASRRSPDDANLLDTLACSYMQLGEKEKAIAAISRAVELEPESRTWRDRLTEFTAP